MMAKYNEHHLYTESSMKTYEHITKTLYVIDDDHASAFLNATVLSKTFKLKTRIITNPDDAFREILVHRNEICGIVVDAYLQTAECRINTGLQLIKEIQIEGMPELPILFCSSLTGPAEIAAMLGYGEYCTKPLYVHVNNPDSALHLFLDRLK